MENVNSLVPVQQGSSVPVVLSSLSISTADLLTVITSRGVDKIDGEISKAKRTLADATTELGITEKEFSTLLEKHIPKQAAPLFKLVRTFLDAYYAKDEIAHAKIQPKFVRLQAGVVEFTLDTDKIHDSKRVHTCESSAKLDKLHASIDALRATIKASEERIVQCRVALQRMPDVERKHKARLIEQTLKTTAEGRNVLEQLGTDNVDETIDALLRK